MGKLIVCALVASVLLGACGGEVEAPPADAGDEPPVCGNGIRESGEDCDDGNNVPSDGCTNCHNDDAQLLHLDAGTK